VKCRVWSVEVYSVECDVAYEVENVEGESLAVAACICWVVSS
jgi:hypothetical protein